MIRPPTTAPNHRLIRIGLVMPLGLAFYREILRGVREQATKQPDWLLSTIAPDPKSIEQSRALKCDGYIAHVFQPAVAKALQRTGKPVVNVAGIQSTLRSPHIHVDHEEVGRIGARHFLDRGLKHFGFVGYQDYEFSIGRERGFRNTLRQAGYGMERYYEKNLKRIDPSGYWYLDTKLMRWLEQVPKPIGILTSHDPQAVLIAENCIQLRLRVPEEIAIVGVDDDDLLCGMARPNLSSVALPGLRIGMEAAKLLQRWLEQGKMPSPSKIILPPRDIVIRQSSDLAAIDEPEVKQALDFIRANVHRVIRVADVVQYTSIAKRSLERRFLLSLGRGIAAEIRRAHLERAQQLLRETGLPIQTVALRSGFTDNRQLSSTFRRILNTSPSAYRTAHREYEGR